MSNIESVYNRANLASPCSVFSDVAQNNCFTVRRRCFSSRAALENDCRSIHHIGILTNSRHNNLLDNGHKCNDILKFRFPLLLPPYLADFGV